MTTGLAYLKSCPTLSDEWLCEHVWGYPVCQGLRHEDIVGSYSHSSRNPNL